MREHDAQGLIIKESVIKAMKYISIPFVSQPVSRVVLGASGPKFAGGGEIGEIMDAALACGVNAVDTARVYGDSEATLGRWILESGQRDKLVLISKGCHPSLFVRRVNEKAAEEDLRRSLDALNTDHIDIYLLHRDDESVPVGRIVEFLNRFQREGRIGAFGGSNWSAARIAEANAYARAHGLSGFAISSPHFSLGRQLHEPWPGCRTLTGPAAADERRFYKAEGMPVLAWSSLCNGVFSGKLKSAEWDQLGRLFGAGDRRCYDCPDNRERLARCESMAAEKGVPVARIALAWLLSSDLNVLPVVGASSPARLRENAAAVDLALTPKERAWLNLEDA